MEQSSQEQEVSVRIDTLRKADRLRGFAYLHSFSELRSWTEAAIDPLQRANIPLLQRPSTNYANSSTSKIMLIHDYRGGYNEYEAVQGAEVEAEMYSCEYLAYVDTFVYFAHELVSAPPPAWTNACHRSGVKVLGTFMVEPGSREVGRILELENGRYWVADKLTRMARIYGFDGWLINIEKSFPWYSWRPNRLEGFLKQMRDDVGRDGRIVWYDALTILNLVSYQNTINSSNLRFALAAGTFLSNYTWTPELAQKGLQTARESGLEPQNVFFGIDVFAQNVQHGRHRRKTYPLEGGGGTGTGLGVKKLAEIGLNSGIFAPGWSYEHFAHYNRAVERSVWMGERLPHSLSCACAPLSPHHSDDYQQNPVTNSAYKFEAGTVTFYHIDFRRAFSKNNEARSNDFETGVGYHADLAAQSILPKETRAPLQLEQHPDEILGCLTAQLYDSPPRCAFVGRIRKQSIFRGTVSASLQIADVYIEDPRVQFEITMVYRQSKTEGCHQAIAFHGPSKCSSMDLDDTHGDIVTKKSLLSQQFSQPITSIAMTFSCETFHLREGQTVDIAEVFSITVQPCGRPKASIVDLRIKHPDPMYQSDMRLAWSISLDANQQADESLQKRPRSVITGPFESFAVFVDSERIGSAYALEFVLPSNIADDWPMGGTETVEIVGIGFDGMEISRCSRNVDELLEGTNEGWVLV